MTSACSIRARGIVPGTASGPALVSPVGLSFLGDIDIRSGTIVNQAHPLWGHTVAGRILVVPYTVGSAGAWRFLYQLHVHRHHPAAILSAALPDSSLVQGAILASVPVLCEPDTDLLAAIRTDDLVLVDAGDGTIEVRADTTNGGP
jgi:predicted aconitase with swiveling domain